MIPVLPSKTPLEVLDYKIDMAAELKGRLADGSDDAIATVAWAITSIENGAGTLTAQYTANDATSATVWLAAGTAGITYEVSATVTTGGGRTYQRSFAVSIGDR